MITDKVKTMCDGCKLDDQIRLFRINSDDRYCDGCYEKAVLMGNALGKSVLYLSEEEINKAISLPLTSFTRVGMDLMEGKANGKL